MIQYEIRRDKPVEIYFKGCISAVYQSRQGYVQRYIYLKFLFSYSMTGAWRWSGHPISWKQTLSLHLWVDINLISLYCICIVIFARLEKKSPEFPLERCSNSRQSAKPRLRTSSPVIRSIKTYHLLSSNHINISKQNICSHVCLVNQGDFNCGPSSQSDFIQMY